MSIRQRNAHFTDWAAVCKALHVNTESEARAALESSDNTFYYYVCYIKSTKEIYTHGQIYSCSGNDDLLDLINELTAEVVENEEVTAKALSDLNENKASRGEVEMFATSKQDKITDLDSIRTKANNAVQPDQISNFVSATDLAKVATTGNYYDLLDRPDVLTTEDVHPVCYTGNYDDLNNKPTIPDAQVNSDWNATSGKAQILNKPSLSTVATTGSYTDLLDIPEDQNMWTKVEGEAGVRLKGTNGTATGNLAISAGDDKTASDGTAFTSAASGDHAVAFGYGNTCAGRTTLAQGLYNTVNGKDSVAFGQRNLINGDQAFAVGQQNEVAARLGVTIGYNNKATNTDSIAIGYQNTSSGSASVAMGDTCEASGTSSTAMGYKTKSTGAYSSTFGQNTQATNSGEVAMGVYNKSTTSTDTSEQTSFSFGIGTSDTNRVNAFEIKKNGDVYIGDKLISGGGITEETDPIFSASPAASITDNKIEEWNNKVDKVNGKQLSTEDFTTALKNKLSGLSNYDDTQINQTMQSLQTQINTLVSGNASNAIESFNEIIAFLNGVEDSQSLDSIIASIEQQIASKQSKIDDLESIRSGATKGESAVQPNDLANVATSGDYNDLTNKPTIPAEQVNADWNATSGKAQILNKPTIPAEVLESTVSNWGFTKNLGTVTSITINGSTKNPSNGVIDLGTVLTSYSPMTVSTSTEGATTSRISPNIKYVYTGDASSNIIFTIDLSNLNTLLDNTWYISFKTGSTIPTINFGISNGYTLMWANGIAPSFEENTFYELTFKLVGTYLLGVYGAFKTA